MSNIILPFDNTENKFYLYEFKTPLGNMISGDYQGKLRLLDYSDSPLIEKRIVYLESIFSVNRIFCKTTLLEKVESQINAYFKGKKHDFTLPLELHGTNFQKKVWNTLIHIQWGKTLTYAEQALMMKIPKAVRAVANANSQNPILIIVPCHRVIGSNGSLKGYSGGLYRKKALLELEKIT